MSNHRPVDDHRVTVFVPRGVSQTHDYGYISETGLDRIAQTINTDEEFLKNVVEDTTPQLGGNLDGQGYSITGVTDVCTTGGICLSTIAASGSYTTADFLTDFAAQTTDDLSEGTGNLYFTDARAVAANTGLYSPLGHNHDHGSLSGLTDNDHPQYALAADTGVALAEYVRRDGTSDLTGNWTISTNNVTLSAGTLSASKVYGVAGVWTDNVYGYTGGPQAWHIPNNDYLRFIMNGTADVRFVDGDNITHFDVGSGYARIPNDTSQLIFGAGNDYTIKYDGFDAVHTVGAGDYEFNANLGTWRMDDSAGTLFYQPTAVNRFESGRIRLTEYSNGTFQGGYIHYDGSSNVMHIGVHPLGGDAVAANDINAITINRATAYVGIGVNPPAERLEVDGNVRLRNDSQQVQFGATQDYTIEYDGGNAIHTITAGDFVFNGGHVGIGTAIPTRDLSVYVDQDDVTYISAENYGLWGSSIAGFEARASTATLYSITHGGGRVITRHGTLAADHAEILSTAGNGLLFGTLHNAPIIIGVNNTEVSRVTSTGVNVLGTVDAYNFSAASSTEVDYLVGVTGNIQDQLDAIDGGGGSGINSIVEDTTPQLGGNLDAQGYDITDVGTLGVGSGFTPEGTVHLQNNSPTLILEESDLGGSNFNKSTFNQNGGLFKLSMTRADGGAVQSIWQTTEDKTTWVQPIDFQDEVGVNGDVNITGDVRLADDKDIILGAADDYTIDMDDAALSVYHKLTGGSNLFRFDSDEANTQIIVGGEGGTYGVFQAYNDPTTLSTVMLPQQLYNTTVGAGTNAHRLYFQQLGGESCFTDGVFIGDNLAASSGGAYSSGTLTLGNTIDGYQAWMYMGNNSLQFYHDGTNGFSFSNPNHTLTVLSLGADVGQAGYIQLFSTDSASKLNFISRNNYSAIGNSAGDPINIVSDNVVIAPADVVTTPSGTFCIEDSAGVDQMWMTHDGANAQFGTTDGGFAFNTYGDGDTTSVMSLGASSPNRYGVIQVHNQDASAHGRISHWQNQFTIYTFPVASGNDLKLQHLSEGGGVSCFQQVPTGNAPSFDVHGFATGAKSRDSVSIAVDVDTVDITTEKDVVDIGAAVSREGFFMATETAGSQTVTAGAAIQWDTENKKDSTFYTFTAGNAEVEVNVDGWYRITAQVSFSVTVGTRCTSQIYLMKDTGGGQTKINGTDAYTYHRDTCEVSTCQVEWMEELNAGDKLQVYGILSAGGTTLATVANGNRFIIEYIQT